LRQDGFLPCLFSFLVLKIININRKIDEFSVSAIEVDIHLSSEEVQRAYEGVENVYAVAVDGRSIRFPVRILWSYIAHNGIHGRFLIHFGEDRKFKEVQRIA